jgi:inorganic triphosphatase YgiF
MHIVNWLETHLDTVMVIISFLTAIAAWLSARAAKRAATETQKATQASLTASLLDSYSSPEMLDGMLRLNDFKTRHGDNFADEFRRLRRDDYDFIRDVDHARRRVSHFFSKIHTLKKLEYLNDNAVKEVATKGQVEFFRHVVEPLEAALNVDYDRSAFESLGRLYGIQPGRLPMANPKPK